MNLLGQSGRFFANHNSGNRNTIFIALDPIVYSPVHGRLSLDETTKLGISHWSNVISIQINS
jgi:hypothetical protein